jgi:undecaprenyl pyrophosphate phosphatase UppP
VCRNPIPLNLDKLHCIIIAMSCMHSHDHADSFYVVVSVASVVVVALCFFSDRTLRDVVSNDKFFGVLRRSCQASSPAPYLPIGVLITYLCLCFLLFFMLALCSDALFESRILSTCFPQSKAIYLPPPAYYLLLVVGVGLASRRHA